MTPEQRQSVLDAEHLRLLSLLHYVSGGMTLVFASMFGVWFTFMSVMLSLVPKEPEVPDFLPGVFLVLFGLFVAFFIALGALEILAGWFISKRRRRVFVIVVSIPNLLFIPYGTLLSIFTIIVLERASVKATFT